jgi:hypothetical protein
MRPGLLVALLAVGLLAAPVGAATSTGAQVADPTTTFGFAVAEDGDANVTVTVTYTLDSANDTAAFEETADEFERGTTGPTTAVFERAAAAASEATNRSMNLSEPTRTTERRNVSGGPDVGVLELAFEWTNFARVDGSRLRVGDAYRTPNGTWLPGLGADQRLRVVGPEGYGYADGGAANIEDGALVWRGPTTFDAGDLRVVLADDSPTPVSPTPPTDATDRPRTTAGTDAPGGEGGDGPFGGLASPGVGGLLLAVALAGVGLYAFVARRDEGPGPAAVGGGADGRPEDDAGTTAPPDATDGGEAMTAGAAAGVDAADGSDSSGDVGADGEGDDDPGPFAGVDEELLSDEERVERLLEYNGGRMKQANIVTETGWSNAKVSQLLSGMDEAERIDKLRIGRENLISLPEADDGIGDSGSS